MRRGIAQAEVGAGVVADLRQRIVDAGLVGAGGIAIENGGQDREIVERRDLDAGPGRRKRVGGAAAWKVVRGDGRPPISRIHEEGRGLADEKFGIRGDFADADQQFVVEEFLLEPGLVKPGGGIGFDAAHGEEIERIVAAEAAAMNLEGLGMQRRALQAGQLVEIDVERGIETALIGSAAFDAARGVAKNLPDVGEGIVDAFRVEIGADAAGVAVGAERSLDGRRRSGRGLGSRCLGGGDGGSRFGAGTRLAPAPPSRCSETPGLKPHTVTTMNRPS